jgi:hypothetical protein
MNLWMENSELGKPSLRYNEMFCHLLVVYILCMLCLVTSVKLDNVLTNGLRIGGREGRINSKVKIQTNKGET